MEKGLIEKLNAAHEVSSKNRNVIDASSMCACFYCQQTFLPSSIKEWWDDDTTAVCPYCGIDSVLGNASEFSLGNEFILAMHDYWFKRTEVIN